MNADVSDLNSNSDSIYQTALQNIPNIKAQTSRVQSFQKGIAVASGKVLSHTFNVYGGLSSNFTSIATNGNTRNRI